MPSMPNDVRQIAEQIAYERGPTEDEWSSAHTSCGYGCCGGGKEIDRAELARVIEAGMTPLAVALAKGQYAIESYQRSLTEQHEKLQAADAGWAEAQRERDKAVAMLGRAGYRRCDSPRCDCFGWHADQKASRP